MCPGVWQNLASLLPSLTFHSTHIPKLPPVTKPPTCSYSDATKQSIPKNHHLNTLTKNASTRNRGTILLGHYSSQTWKKSLVLLKTPTTTSKHSNFTAILRLYNNTVLLPSSLLPAPLPQPELFNYSNFLNFSIQSINIAKTPKIWCSDLTQPIQIFSINNKISANFLPCLKWLIKWEPLSSQFNSPTPSQTLGNSFNPIQGSVSNVVQLLSQAQWNHSIRCANSSLYFQHSLSSQGLPNF